MIVGLWWGGLWLIVVFVKCEDINGGVIKFIYNLIFLG